MISLLFIRMPILGQRVNQIFFANNFMRQDALQWLSQLLLR